MQRCEGKKGELVRGMMEQRDQDTDKIDEQTEDIVEKAQYRVWKRNSKK